MTEGEGHDARAAAAPRVLALGALLLGFAILVLGNGLQNTLLGVRAGREGMAPETVGLFMSAYFVGFAVGSVLVPSLVQRVGHIRTFAALASMASAIALLHAILVTPTAWILFRLAHGACLAGLIMVVESWLNSATEQRYRGRVLATYAVVLYGATALSQPLLNLASPSGFVLFCVVSICLSLALVPITLMRAGGPGYIGAERQGLARLYETSPVAVVGAVMIGFALGAVWGMGPTFAQGIGLEASAIATFLSLITLGALVMQWPLGWISDLVGRRRVMFATCLLAGAASLALGMGPEPSRMVLYALAFGFGAFSTPMYSLVVAHMNDLVRREELIAAASGLILIYGVGAALGPFAASLAMARLGPGGLFLLVALVHALFAAYIVARIVVSGPVRRALRERFVGVPSTTHAYLPLHRHARDRGPGTRARA